MTSVCETCGDHGFVEALVYCDSCKLGAVHRYCLGIVPVPLEEYITWFCAHCDETDSDSDTTEVDQTAHLRHTSYTPLVIQDAVNVEVSSSPIIETMNESKGQQSSNSEKPQELASLVTIEASVLDSRNGASGPEKSEQEMKKKKKIKSIDNSLPVLAVEDHELHDPTIVEPSEVSSSTNKETASRQTHELANTEKMKMNEESSNHTLPVVAVELHDLTNIEPVKETAEVSKRQESSDSAKPLELTDLARNEAPVLEKSGAKKEKKKKMNKEERRNCTSLVLDVEDHGLQHTTNVEPAKVSSLAIKETMKESEKQESSDHGNSREITGLVRNGVSVLETGVKKKKKKNNESSNLTSAGLFADDRGLENLSFLPMKETMQSKKQENSDRSFHELTDLVTAPVLEKSEKKKKKNEERSNHTSSVIHVEDPALQHTTNVEQVKVSSLAIKETVKESKKRESSNSGNSHELTGLLRNEVPVLEISVKKKKKKKKNNNNEEKKSDESSNHTSAVLSAVDHGLQDSTNAELVNVSSLPVKETTKECKKRKGSDSGNSHELTGLVKNGVCVLETNEKRKKKKKTKKEEKNEESSNHTTKVLAAENHGLQDTTNDETMKVPCSPCKETTIESKRQESSGSGNPNELTGIVIHRASVSEGGISSVADHNSCTSKNTQVAAGNSSCKEAESNMLQKNEVLTATVFNSVVINSDRGLPIYKPIWRGSISVKNANICCIDGLVAHLSSLACHEVHEKASSLHVLLSGEMFLRMEIWPSRFLDKGQPTDESIALYFFPSSECDGMVYYSFLHEMKKNDLAMRCVLDNVDLLLFTSYQLPLHCWTFYSKEYLWGIFRRRKTSRH